MPEPTGLDTRRIGWAAFGIVGGIAFAVAGAALLLHFSGPANNSPTQPVAVPAPRLQTAPVPERAAYFAEKERRLNSYGWIDAKAGIAHIPIEEAMRLQAARKGESK